MAGLHGPPTAERAQASRQKIPWDRQTAACDAGWFDRDCGSFRLLQIDDWVQHQVSLYSNKSESGLKLSHEINGVLCP